MSIICGPGSCPNDPTFEHDDYFGCIPRDFNQRTGRSNKYWQEPGKGWNGGCDAAAIIRAHQEPTIILPADCDVCEGWHADNECPHQEGQR